jgi:hypothetical protein
MTKVKKVFFVLVFALTALTATTQPGNQGSDNKELGSVSEPGCAYSGGVC